MYPTPLPENPFPPSALHDAYEQCLTLQGEAHASRVAQVMGYPPPIVCARLLGHLLRLASAGDPQGKIQHEITLAQSEHATLMKLAATYLNSFIYLFRRSSSGPTPESSENPSHPASEVACEYVAMMEQCQLDYYSAQTWAMHRDNDLCMITGLEDFRRPNGYIPLDTGYIIPRSVNSGIEEGYCEGCSSAGGVRSILSLFSLGTISKDLAGGRIHRLENVLSMNRHSRIAFERLYLWLKPAEEGAPNTYHVCTGHTNMRLYPPLPEYVTFSTSTNLPLPNPEYLALHALCCEVVWMSGAMENILDFNRRMDETYVLAADGSSVDLLMMALLRVEVHAPD